MSLEQQNDSICYQEEQDLDTLLAKVHSLAAKADNAGRVKTLDKLRDLSYSIETADDTAKRLLYNNLVHATIRVGIDLKVFDILCEASGPLTTKQLAEATGAAPVFLGRLLRYLASIAIIGETGENTYLATKMTDAITVPGYKSGLLVMFDMMNPVFQAMPSFFKESGYADVTDVTKTPLTKTYNLTNKSMFEWLPTKPEWMAHFNALMKAWEQNQQSWLNVYPLQQACQNRKREQPLFVDDGGGLGHQAIRLAERFPKIDGRIVVQDMQGDLMAKLKHEKVEFMQHDFFQSQPIKGAKIYYLRHILHDWPDDKCILILENLKAAMAPNSVILIDEMVLPNTGTHWQAAQMDMIMMINLAARERSEKEWNGLLDNAGLQLKNIWTYDPSIQHAVIEVVLPERRRRTSNI